MGRRDVRERDRGGVIKVGVERVNKKGLILCIIIKVCLTDKLDNLNCNIFTHNTHTHAYIQDVALVSLANVLYRSGFDKDATAVIHMSLEVCQRTSTCEVNSSIIPSSASHSLI